MAIFNSELLVYQRVKQSSTTIFTTINDWEW